MGSIETELSEPAEDELKLPPIDITPEVTPRSGIRVETPDREEDVLPEPQTDDDLSTLRDDASTRPPTSVSAVAGDEEPPAGETEEEKPPVFKK